MDVVTPHTQRAAPGAKLRHYCRNPRCRTKLPAPVENPHHGFCCRGCHSSFYRSRCLVCEDQMKRKRSDQRIKSGHGKCAAEYRRFPRAYDLPRPSDAPPVGISNESFAEAHSTGLKTCIKAERPRRRALRHWAWHSGELEHELRDADSTLLARLESNAGRHRLTHPRTIPILSWADLDEAKHRAEAVALSNLPNLRKIDTSTPMGPPLNRQLSQESAIYSDWKPTGNGADMPPIPDFLRRSA